MAEEETLLAEMEQHRSHLMEVRHRAGEPFDAVTGLQALIDADEKMTPEQATQSVDLMGTVRRRLLTIVRESTGLSIAVRVDLVTLPDIPFGSEEAVRAGLNCRLDLMNRRGFVMDARRRLEVAADRLEATVDLVAEGEVNTKPLLENGNPVDFRAKDSSYRVGVAVTTPLDRRRERNNFRAAQISFQRARRNFMAAEDQVKLDVRRQLRMAGSQREIFESNRRALRIAARELDQAIEFGERPDAPDGGQGVNVSRALDNILLAQNELIEAWVDYETARLGLYRDVGVMEIDERGHWIESADISACLNGNGVCGERDRVLVEEVPAGLPEELPQGDSEAEYERIPTGTAVEDAGP